MKKTEEILKIINNANVNIPMSWGYRSPISIYANEGLIFHVNGYIHQGFVKVTAQSDNIYYKVILLNEEKGEVKCIENVTPKALVSEIDKAIELTDNYNERIQNEIDVLGSMKIIGSDLRVIEYPDFTKLSMSMFFQKKRS